MQYPNKRIVALKENDLEMKFNFLCLVLKNELGRKFLPTLLVLRFFCFFFYLTMAKKKKDSNFNKLLRTDFFDLPKIPLGSNSKSNYLLSKKIRTQKS